LNIYGDYKLCRCGNHADLVEGSIDLCVDCFVKKYWNKPLDEVGRDLDEKEKKEQE